MNDFTGLPISDVGVLVTREVRWFHRGEVPTGVVEWFTEGGHTGIRENRADTYDLAQARRGIGLKYRGGESYDVKHRVSVQDPLVLAGSVGRIEDWLKVSHPIGGQQGIREPVVVEKQILTRRYVIPERGDVRGFAGSDIEVSTIRIAGEAYWSFALETFGHPLRRAAALQGGLEQMLADIPIPAEVPITSDTSCGYPGFLASLGTVPGERHLRDVDGLHGTGGWFGTTSGS